MEILLSENAIAARVRELGEELAARYQGKPLTAVILLNGAFIFAADLLRRMDLDIQVETLRVASYQGSHSTGKVSFASPLKTSLTGRHVLLIDDILDSGLTFARVQEKLMEQSPADIRTCVFLEKDIDRPADALRHADFAAFHVPNRFIVGYGLDHDEHYRNLPYVAALD